jgi:polyhydroxyalkanoate synthesis repressor PhaR
MAKGNKTKNGPIIIKKYANRRLYDTGRSSYVTLDDLCEMIKEGLDFIVVDAKSGDDITRSVLTQIIADQESRGENLLPTNFLRTLIGFYGDNIQGFIPGYLEQTLDSFVKNQENLKEQINKSLEGMRTMEGMFPGTANLEDLQKQNMEMFERAMKMITPFGMPPYGSSSESSKK